MFSLSDIVTMQPEGDALSSGKKGTAKRDEYLLDATSEVGNLLVASWDKVFSEQAQLPLTLHQNRTVIGDPWNIPDTFDLSHKDLLILPYELIIDDSGSLDCLVVFPESILRVLSQQEDSDNPDIAETPNVQDTPSDPVSRTIRNMIKSIPVIPAEHARALLAVPAQDIMKTDILWGTPQDSVAQAIEKMEQAEATCMLIGNPSLLEGIITWADITAALSVYLRPEFHKWRRPADDATLQIKTQVIMTRSVCTVMSNTPLSMILEDMNRFRLQSVPVVDEGAVVGLISVFDIFSFIQNMVTS